MSRRLVLAAWAIASLARVPPLDRPLPPDTVPPPLGLLALVGVTLFGVAAVRYAELYRRRRRPLPLAVLVAFILSTLRRIDRRDAERLAEVVGTIRS
jgi:adenylate cyclase